MTCSKWTITTYINDQQRDVEVIVYDTLAIMRREATKWANRVTPGQSDFSNSGGVCHGFERVRCYEDGTEKPYPHAATIRLAKGHTTPLIVSHEIAHAAQHLYALDHLGYDSKELAVDHFGAANENFAYLYGELFSAAWEAINNRNPTTG